MLSPEPGGDPGNAWRWLPLSCCAAQMRGKTTPGASPHPRARPPRPRRPFHLPARGSFISGRGATGPLRPPRPGTARHPFGPARPNGRWPVPAREGVTLGSGHLCTRCLSAQRPQNLAARRCRERNERFLLVLPAKQMMPHVGSHSAHHHEFVPTQTQLAGWAHGGVMWAGVPVLPLQVAKGFPKEPSQLPAPEGGKLISILANNLQPTGQSWFIPGFWYRGGKAALLSHSSGCQGTGTPLPKRVNPYKQHETRCLPGGNELQREHSLVIGIAGREGEQEREWPWPGLGSCQAASLHVPALG